MFPFGISEDELLTITVQQRAHNSVSSTKHTHTSIQPLPTWSSLPSPSLPLSLAVLPLRLSLEGVTVLWCVSSVLFVTTRRRWHGDDAMTWVMNGRPRSYETSSSRYSTSRYAPQDDAVLKIPPQDVPPRWDHITPSSRCMHSCTSSDIVGRVSQEHLQCILHPNQSPSKRCSSSEHEWNKSMFNDIHVHIQVNGWYCLLTEYRRHGSSSNVYGCVLYTHHPAPRSTNSTKPFSYHCTPLVIFDTVH
jgi:hypothetical protein